jgi:uncharacterized cupredoxin-like copper-binding protein
VSPTALVPIERQIGKVRRHAVRQKYRKRTMTVSLAARATLGLILGASPCPLPVAAAADVDWAQAQRIAVTMTDYRFTPSHLAFHRGVPYQLTLENAGTVLHEFTAPDFFRAVSVNNPEIMTHEGQEILLRPHERKEVYLVPRQPGHYKLICADHDFLGMTGEITIE